MRPLAIFLVFGAGLMVPMFGQSQQDEDGPGRGVARLSILNGEVSIRRGDSGDLVAAALNAPLVVQDRLLTGPSSRAELQFDYSNMMRIGANAEVRLSELEYHKYQIQIAQGTTTFRVLRNQESQVELSTPSVSVRPLKKGIYRISVHADGTSEITVRSGEAGISTPAGSERLGSGRTMVARGTANDPEFQVVAGLTYDDWDRWNDARDRDLERSQSYNYVGQDVYGAEDLDAYGTWVDVPSYGRVWRPVVVDDWAPYRYGRWSWVDYYGWTWVSYDPWGWAPYHYGRWFNQPGYGWCWWPGGPGRTYWRPALVAFFGWGNYGGFHAGIGFGYGHVGWVPLAPHESFHPWYGRGYYGGYRNTTIVNNTTIINNTNIGNIYRNARVSNGITGMNAESFGRGHITNGNYARVSNSDIQRAGLVRGQLPLTPSRDSLRMGDRQVQAQNMPRTSDSRQFFSTRQPTRVDRVPFDQQRQGVEQTARRTFGGDVRSSTPSAAAGRSVEPGRGNGSDVRNPAPSAAAGRSVEPGRGIEPSRGGDTGSGGWRRVGESPAAQAPNSQMSAPQGRTQQQDTWHRFGEPSQHTRGEVASPSSPVDRGSDPGRGNSRQDSFSRGAASHDNSSWRRFGDPGGGSRMNTPSLERQSSPTPQVDRSPRQNYPAPEYRSTPSVRESQDSYRGGGFGSIGRGGDSSPVRINPPIVRERSSSPSYSSPRMESPRGGGGGSSPRMESPRSSGGGGGGGGGSAPRSSGGGGGGGGRGGSGGGNRR